MKSSLQQAKEVSRIPGFPSSKHPTPPIEKVIQEFSLSRQPEKVIQRAFQDDKEAQEQARKFFEYHEQEKTHIIRANAALTTYYALESPTKKNYEDLKAELTAIRTTISANTGQMADIIKKYQETDNKELRYKFLEALNEDYDPTLCGLFNKLVGQTVIEEGKEEDCKNRFLVYVLQSMFFQTGMARFRELMSLLGDRKIFIHPRAILQAGLEEADPLAEKENSLDETEDRDLFESKDSDFMEFIESKREQGDKRIANRQMDEVQTTKEEKKQDETHSSSQELQEHTIGDLALIMEQHKLLFPVFWGAQKTGKIHKIQAFTPPMFTSIHHEVGHLINYLKRKVGKSGESYSSDSPLNTFNNEEELYNISIDPYGDHAFSQELGLPERISHKGLITMDALNSESYPPHPETEYSELKDNILSKIRDIVNSNWNAYTIRKKKPDTVSRISNLTGTTGDTTTPATSHQILIKIQQLSKKASSSSSTRRQTTTKDFYQILSNLTISSEISLIQTLSYLNKFQKQYFSS